MAEVYKFKVRLKELEKYIWRDIEITSVSSIAKLGYAVLAAFDANGSHLFCVKFAGVNYEFVFEDDIDYVMELGEETLDPTATKLSALKLKIGDSLTMEYDYGAGWEFDIKLISISEMKKGTGTHYPYITDGAGNGIIEDTNPAILAEYIEETDKTGTPPTYYNFEWDREDEWDYRSFDLEYSNMGYKDRIFFISDAYENPDEY